MSHNCYVRRIAGRLKIELCSRIMTNWTGFVIFCRMHLVCWPTRIRGRVPWAGNCVRLAGRLCARTSIQLFYVSEGNFSNIDNPWLWPIWFIFAESLNYAVRSSPAACIMHGHDLLRIMARSSVGACAFVDDVIELHWPPNSEDGCPLRRQGGLFMAARSAAWLSSRPKTATSTGLALDWHCALLCLWMGFVNGGTVLVWSNCEEF